MGGVGCITMIIMLISVQVELHWNLPTGAELGKIMRIMATKVVVSCPFMVH